MFGSTLDQFGIFFFFLQIFQLTTHSLSFVYTDNLKTSLNLHFTPCVATTVLYTLTALYDAYTLSHMKPPAALCLFLIL